MRLKTTLGMLAALVLAVVLAVTGILPRLRARQALRTETDRQAAPPVNIVRPTRAPASEELVLPGNIQAFIDAPIYARTNGYLRHWYFDIGTRVKRGQLLAEIESPEVDRQLQQAREDLRTDQANLDLAQTTAKRYEDLFKSDSVAKQDVDNAAGNRAARAATVLSAKANVQRLEQMVGFERLYAPFDGVVTARNTDVGQLIESGSAGGPTRELFHVAAIDKLRVFVQVPQAYAHQTLPGLAADLTFPELPGRRFPGSLVRTAKAIDQTTRTLNVEVDALNQKGELFPGAYTEVHFKLHGGQLNLVVPATSLMFRSEGLRLPIVDSQDRVHFIVVTVGRDFGNTVEVIAGLGADARIVANPPDALVDGEVVRIVTARPQSEAGE